MQDSFTLTEQLRLEGTPESLSCQTLTSLVSLKQQKIKLIHGSKNGLHLDSKCIIYWQSWLLSFLIVSWSMIKQLIKGLHDSKSHSGWYWNMAVIEQVEEKLSPSISVFLKSWNNAFVKMNSQSYTEPASFLLHNTAVEAFYFILLPLLDQMPTSKFILRGPDFFLFYRKGYCEAKMTRESGLGAGIYTTTWNTAKGNASK